MDSDLKILYDRVMQSTRPEEVFGEMNVVLPPRLLEEHLSDEMKTFHQTFDETLYSSPSDLEGAQDARIQLDTFHAEAMQKAEQGLYNVDGFIPLVPPDGGQTITVQDTQYSVGTKRYIGEHSTLFDARFPIDGGSAGAVIRIANTAADNSYLHNELRVLNMLHQHDVGYWRSLPFVFGRFSSGKRMGIVYRLFEGYTLEEIRANSLHKDGLDQRHMIWILDRMLNILGYTHAVGLVHGHVEPLHIRVRPSNHNILLTGWAHAVHKPATTGERTISTGGVFEAPEMSSTGEVGPWTDIYSLGKTLIWLVGGNPVTNDMPDVVEQKIQQFLLHMVQQNPRARPHDAWQLYKAQNTLKDSLWKRRFRHLDMA